MIEPLNAAVLTLARLSRILERDAAPLSLADFRALSAIVGGEGRASRLAQRLAVGKPSISATVDSLARRGLISRERVDGDQRAIALAITPEGQAVYETVLGQMSRSIDQLASGTKHPEVGLGWLQELGEVLETQRSQRPQRADS